MSPNLESVAEPLPDASAKARAVKAQELDPGVDRVAEVEQRLLDQRVVIVRPCLKRCSVSAGLAGFDVKLKCRGSHGTFEKSETHRVPNGGGELYLCEPTFDVVFEGDQVLDFDLCNASRCCLRRNMTLAKGSLSLATVFKDAGLQGSPATLTVELLSTDDQNMGCVDVDICCSITTLGSLSLGLKALKVYSLPRRPDVAWPTREYTNLCINAGVRLGQARHSAEKFAGVRAKKLRARSASEEASATARDSKVEEDDRERGGSPDFYNDYDGSPVSGFSDAPGF